MTHRQWKLWLLAIAASLVVGLAFAAQDVGWRAAEHLPFDWGRALRRYPLYWLSWALFLPPIGWLTNVLPFEPGRVALRLPAWLGMGLLVVLAHTALFMTVSHFLGWLTPPPPPAQPNLLFGIYVGFLAELVGKLVYFGLIAAAFHAVRYSREMNARALERAALESRLTSAELDVLRMRQQPHFFFNTLNTVSALVESNPAAARGVLARLGDLLRLSLDGVAQEITLEEELAILDQYVEIQRARFRERLAVIVNADQVARAMMVPTFMLQPLLENAVRHALERKREPLTVTVRAAVVDRRLTVTVEDDGPGSDPGAAPHGRGLGLSSLRARLTQLYGPAHRFESGNLPGGGFGVTIRLPARERALP